MANLGSEGKLHALLARARTDDILRAKLLADPVAALRAEGIVPPPGIQVKAVENTDNLFHIVLPAKQEALADEALEQVAAGVGEMGFNMDVDKPCGNITCRIVYGSQQCRNTWSISFGDCIYEYFGKPRR